MNYGFYFTGSLEAMTNIQLVGNNGTLCFLQELLQLVSFSSYFEAAFKRLNCWDRCREIWGRD
jgi:hypothetical protein